MKINIVELIDFEEVNKLLEGFNQSTGFVTAILDLEGNILSKSGWRQICTEFHRKHPETSKNCSISDTVLANQLKGDEKYHFYQCVNGLVDVAVPIVIKGEHIANLFSGQFFFEAPDRSIFEKQAEKFGFDKQAYMNAFDKVPIISKEKVIVAMDFVLNMTQLISEITVQKMDQQLLHEEITNRKSKEAEEIARLNERISTATRASQIGIWEWDVQKNELTWDSQMYAIYGLDSSKYMNAYDNWYDGMHPDDSEFSKNEARLALNGEKVYDTQFRIIWPDGSIHHIKAKGDVLRNEQGEPVRVVGITFDVTEQVRKDEKIREKDLEFRKLSANVPDLIYQFTRKPDGSYCVPIASEGIRNIFGCSPEDVLDDFSPIAKVIYPEDTERVIREIEYSADHLTYFACEFRVHIPGKDIQWIYSNSSPERLPDGSITWYGFNTDITSRKKAEDAVKEMNETLERRVDERTAQLEAANNELEAFSYSVSHDLRAPLRHINGYVDLLNDRFKENLPEKAQHYLSTISNATKQMGVLIDDLLQFSRTGRQELHKTKFDMNTLFNEVFEKMKPDLKGRDVVWNVQELPMVFGDYSLLKQVWINLLDNAVKYTRLEKTAEISVNFVEEGGNYVFLIRDNGVGFNMKYASKLFGVFQRLHTQAEFEGTGIGLANVQRILQKHDGKAWAEAELNKGATFFFRLPKK